jgi:GxxExxY protein
MLSFKENLAIACIKIFNELGYGLSEIAYEKALSEELRDYGYHTQTEVHVNEYYITSKKRKIEIASLRIDILVDDKYIIELKTLENKIKKKKENDDNNKKEFLQCKRYMKLLNINDCFLINFSKKGLELIKIDL